MGCMRGCPAYPDSLIDRGIKIFIIDSMNSPSPQPRVVAIVPCYASRLTIRSTVESLLQQTRALDLIVIVDDRSGDGFEHEIKDLLDAHPQVKIHQNAQNLGVSESRNEGFRHYAADFYILCDADDEALEHRVEASLKFMQEHPQCGVMGSYIYFKNARGKRIGVGKSFRCFTSEEAKYFRESLESIGFLPSTMCVRGEVVREDRVLFPPDLTACEDREFVDKVLEAGWDALCLPEPLCDYRVHATSISTSRPFFVHLQGLYAYDRLLRRRTRKEAISFEQFIENYKTKSLCSRACEFTSVFAQSLYRRAGFHLMQRQFIRGGTLLSLSILLKPTLLKKLKSFLKKTN